MMKRKTSAHHDEMMGIVEAWQAAGGEFPASAAQIADFAVRRGFYSTPGRLKELCARELARAMREEYIRDGQGRPVRKLHAARITQPDGAGGETQLTLWADIETALRGHMEVAFRQRREQVVGDCRQLSNDVEYFNNRLPREQWIQVCFDFTDDVTESNLPEEYSPLSPKG